MGNAAGGETNAPPADDGPAGNAASRTTVNSVGGGRADTTTSTTAVCGDQNRRSTGSGGNSKSNKRVIRQAVPSQSRNAGQWIRRNSSSSSKSLPTPSTPEDRPRCVNCPSLPCAADGYVACCRTCKVTMGKSHGPSCPGFAGRRHSGDGDGEAGDDVDSVDSDLVSVPDMEELVLKAKQHQMEAACTHFGHDSDEFKWLPIWTTPVASLGQFGTGVRLYFEFLTWMGWTFALLQFLTVPMMAMTAMGSFAGEMLDMDVQLAVNEIQKTLVYLTLGNLGYCGEGSHCQTRASREMRSFSTSWLWNKLSIGPSDMKLRDATLWYALNDCLAVVVFSLSIFIFRKRRHETVVEEVDDANVTATDFAIKVDGLPKVLENNPEGEKHTQYAELLQAHFEDLVKAMFPDTAGDYEDGEDPRVVEVVLVREWNDALNKYQTQGDYLLAKENVKTQLALCKSKLQLDACSEEVRPGLKKKQAALKKKLTKIEDKIHQMEDLLHNSAVPMAQRAVLGAYVVFNEERFKDRIIQKYRPHNSRLTRSALKDRYKFEGKRITCTKAREPLDLMWENMDSPPRRAFNARMCTRILTVVLVVAVLVGIIRLRSVPLAHALSPPANKVWSIYNSTSCFELSDLKFYSDTHCTQELTNYTCVDPDSPGLSTTACQSMLTSFESASCPGANGNAYGVAVKFDEDTTVNCIAATLGPATTADFIQFEACDDSFVGGNLKNSEWEDNPQCTLLRPIDLPEDTTGTGGQTMVVERITDLETSCSRFDDTTEDAEQVLDRVESRGYTLVTEVAFEPRLSCFCDAKRQDSGPFWAWQSVAEDPSAEHEVCEDWLQVYRGKIWQSTLAGIVVVFANQLLKAIFGVIDKIKVFKSRTQLQTGSMTNLCFTQVLVTGAMVFIASQNFTYTLDRLHLRAKGEYYDDFSVGWYTSVAASYYPVLAGQAASCLAIVVALKLILRPLTLWVKTRHLYVQVAINEAYEFAEWKVAARYSESLTIIFCTMLFSSIMPGVYSIGACYCFVAYWIDKWHLLRDCARPPNYDDGMAKFAITVCRFAVLMHLVVAIWAFGCQDVFPSDWGPSWATKMMQKITGVPASEYDHIMLVHESHQHDDYQLARLNDLARMGCLPSVLCFLPLAVHYTKIIFVMIFKPCVKSISAAVKTVQHKSVKAVRSSVEGSGSVSTKQIMVGGFLDTCSACSAWFSIARSDATKQKFMDIRREQMTASIGGGETASSDSASPGLARRPSTGSTNTVNDSNYFTDQGHLMSYDIKWHPKYRRAYEALTLDDTGAVSAGSVSSRSDRSMRKQDSDAIAI